MTKQLKKWSQAIVPPAQEFGPVSLSVVAGNIPEGLCGSLYRNGPARLERGGQRMGHWFDGDGAILAVHFTGTQATGIYRFVKTAGYQAEESADKLLYGNYGMVAPVPYWKRFQTSIKNVANTSVLALSDQLLALWEGGAPHALDLQTLETLGLENLNFLQKSWPFSAHPKVDPQTGEIYNFGITPGPNSTLHLYRCERHGKLLKHQAISLKGVPLIHDFVMAGPYLVFFIPPVRLNLWPALLQLKSYSECLHWHPNDSTQFLVIDRHSLEVVSRGEAKPWYQWHFGNGFIQPDGTLVLDVVRYEDFQTNQRLKEVAAGQTQTLAEGTLWRLFLDPKIGKLLEQHQQVQRSCEFPVVAPDEVSQSHRYTYLSVHHQDADITTELYGTIARYDAETNTLTEAPIDKNQYPTEPIYAPDAQNPQQGWVLTVVYDGNSEQSEVWIFDAGKLVGEAPVCRLALPNVVPMGFHGTWAGS
jgi:all-trans-8'-apo-beta-carotenal 15,15'-oxygenase